MERPWRKRWYQNLKKKRWTAIPKGFRDCRRLWHTTLPDPRREPKAQRRRNWRRPPPPPPPRRARTTTPCPAAVGKARTVAVAVVASPVAPPTSCTNSAANSDWTSSRDPPQPPNGARPQDGASRADSMPPSCEVRGSQEPHLDHLDYPRFLPRRYSHTAYHLSLEQALLHVVVSLHSETYENKTNFTFLQRQR